MKSIIFLTSTVCSIAGSYLPNLWGDSNGFGATALALGAIGAIGGIFLGWKIGNELGL